MHNDPSRKLSSEHDVQLFGFSEQVRHFFSQILHIFSTLLKYVPTGHSGKQENECKKNPLLQEVQAVELKLQFSHDIAHGLQV